MTDPELAQWLLENGGPAVRYRTATELMDGPPGVNLRRLRRELLASRQVRKWLGRVGSPGGLGSFHHSRPAAFENVMAKFAELGLRAGMRPLDAKVRPFRKWLTEHAGGPASVLRRFMCSLAAAALVRAGYRDKALSDYLAVRLDELHGFARKGCYDVYAEPADWPDIPQARRGKPLLDPARFGAGSFPLPWIHDVYLLAHCPSDSLDAAVKRKITTVVKYILDARYQGLAPGYGIFRAGPRHYYGMGWSVRLPGWRRIDPGEPEVGQLVQRVELMAHFPAARKHRWFRRCLRHLEGHRTESRTYLFPGHYLRERPSGYWVGGAYMGLEERRRSPRAFEIESTFRMLKIRRLAAGA